MPEYAEVRARLDDFARDCHIDAETQARAESLARRKHDAGFGRTASWIAYTALAETVEEVSSQ